MITDEQKIFFKENINLDSFSKEIQLVSKNNKSIGPSVSTSLECYREFSFMWNEDIDIRERIKVMYLNNANKIIGFYELGSGGYTATVADMKLLFVVAFLCGASNFIVAHNHPSGNLKPSTSDIELTKKIKKAGRVLDINLLDHLILTKDSYYSFADEGLIH
jgi:DNA repair protein RadC